MRIRIKTVDSNGVMRLEGIGEIQEMAINEDISHPEGETIAIYWRGQEASGIIDISPSEAKKIHETIKKRTDLVKGVKRIKIKGPSPI